MQSGTAWRPSQGRDGSAIHERLAAIIGNAAVGLAELSPDGRFLLVNRELCHILGYSAEMLLATSFAAITAEDALEPLQSALESVARSAEDRVAIEHPCLTAEGETVWMHCELTRLGDDDAPSSVLLVATDVTARKQAERSLDISRQRRTHLEHERQAEEQARLETQQRLQMALDAARMGTWSWRPHQDSTSFDATAVRILDTDSRSSHSFAAALEKHLARESREEYLACVRRIMQPDAPDDLFEVELPWVRSDGRRIWIQLTGQAQYEGSGRLRRASVVNGTVLDITPRKRAEEALAEASLQKDRFLAMLAHELRNPLAPVAYAVQLLRDDFKPELEWSRSIIERQVKHMSRLIDDLLDVSRINRDRLAVQRRRIQIGEVIRAAVEASQPALQAAAQTLELDLPQQPVYLDGDLVRLTQVFTNLLENAAKFSVEPGRVWLTVQPGETEATVTVRDTGVGIPAQELPHVFDMFYQSDALATRMRSGLGIGLYLVRRLVELHGGTVEAKSAGESMGSEFVVKLPVLPPEVLNADTATADPATDRASTMRVLVVDDNKDSADALARLLEVSGHTVEVRYDGAAAIAAAERSRPDVIFLDLGMPKTDGYEVCREIRARPWGEGTSIVALTGWGRPEDRERTRAAGFDAHLVKPVDMSTIEPVLRRRENL